MHRFPLPSTRSALLRTLGWFVCGVLLASCQRATPPPAAPSVADLHFPVAVIFGNVSVVEFENSAALQIMRAGNLVQMDGPPPLIDSDFAVYRLRKLQSPRGLSWLIAHPSGVTPVTFALEWAPVSGISAARMLFRSQLDIQTGRNDLKAKRQELDAAQTLEGMLKIVRGPEH